MATKANKLTPVEQCKQYISSKKNFVLQGGAGSGKTQTLKELLLFIKYSYPTAKVVCITHTNAAVEEIVSRIGEGFLISTIHSFLNNLIKDYKKNIKTVIANIFTVKEMVRIDRPAVVSEKEYNLDQHEQYKKVYEKYEAKLFDIKKETVPKYAGKRDYDKCPKQFNEEINRKIRELNSEIEAYIDNCDFTKIKYNETAFNSYSDISFGHDGLLQVFHLLFEKYPVLSKMVKDKYDYIFIDEYQDSNENIIKDLISIANDDNLTIALFGDSMQAIYKEGIGNVKPLIDSNDLIEVEKPDNYRCSYEVLNLINPLRLDDIIQEVALKSSMDGAIEKETDRHGETTIIYSVCESKPHSRSTLEEKLNYQSKVDELLQHAQTILKSPKILMLTNKSISKKSGFEHLYKVFDDRYVDVKDRIENYLSLIQVLDICNLCYLYKNKSYNSLIKQIRAGGFVLSKGKDKITLKEHMDRLMNNSKLSISQALLFAKEKKLIKESETYKKTVARDNKFLEELRGNERYQLFKKHFLEGKNTFPKIKDCFDIKSEEAFKFLEYQYKQERFIKTFFSEDIKFSQALNYYEYLNEEKDFITMHKTKGSSIQSIIVVMEEFFWNDYDFSLIYTSCDEAKQKMREISQKLIYVACSRAKNSIVCLKVLKKDEVKNFKSAFPSAILYKDYTI